MYMCSKIHRHKMKKYILHCQSYGFCIVNKSHTKMNWIIERHSPGLLFWNGSWNIIQKISSYHAILCNVIGKGDMTITVVFESPHDYLEYIIKATRAFRCVVKKDGECSGAVAIWCYRWPAITIFFFFRFTSTRSGSYENVKWNTSMA